MIIILFLLLFFFWYNLPEIVALIATIILIFWAIYKHNQSLPVEAQSKPHIDNDPNTQLIATVLLYLELKQQHRLGHLSTDDYNYLTENIDIIYTQLVKKLGITGSQRQVQLETAWILLRRQVGGDNLGAPPWRSTSQPTSSPIPAKEKSFTQKSPVQPTEIQVAVMADSPTVTPQATSLPKTEAVVHTQKKESPVQPAKIQMAAVANSPTVTPPQATFLPKVASNPAQATLPPVNAEPLSFTQTVEKTTPAAQPIIAPPQSALLPKVLKITKAVVHTQQKKTAFSWLPRQFNRELFTRLLLPFLWQNLGWFIGGFCFISGSVFLVTNTTGFAKAVTVFTILYLYTLLLFWGSYQIRRRRPQLLTASHVLSTLAVLLVPLDLAAATRLIQSSLPNLGLVSLTILGVVITVGLLVIATRLASGMMERHLQNEHPYLFIALASLQLVIPIVNFIPHWLVLAGLHVSLLSLLSYALWRFSQQWLYAIFIEPHPVAYYAAGTLIYAAIVTFIHSIWASGITLPAGYVGPFLMALCFLLLQVDIQFKQWVHKQALLSHFTFVIYGLSVIAVLYSWVGLIPITLTLMIGSVVYGMMLWNYLTLPPLYLLLACLSGLYGLLILQYFPYHWYFLLSLPGLSSLMGLHHWAQQRHSMALAIICYRVIFSLGLGLFIWSLYHVAPGEIGWLTAIAATVVITTWSWRKPVDFYPPGGAKYYQYAVFVGLITITLAYTPLYLGLSWITQFSSGLVILSVLWSAWGLFIRRVAKESAVVFVNSALLSLIASVILVAIYLPTSLPGLLVAVSGVLLWLSLSLYSRTLFYVTLIALGTAGIVFKNYYLQESSGKGIILLAVGVWMLLWWLHYRIIYLPARSTTRKPVETIANQPDLTLLGLLTLSPTTYANRFELLKPPLEQTLVLAWLIGLGSTLKSLILINSLAEILTSSWSSTLIWNAVVTALIAGQLQRLELIPLALALFAGALWTLGSVQIGWLLAITGAVLIWINSLFIFSHSRSWMTFLGWSVKEGIRPLVEQIIHWTVVAICFISLAGVMSFNFALVQLATLAVAILFFAWAGWRYQLQLHSYMVIGCTILSLPILSFSLLGWLTILLPTIPLYLLALLAIGLAVLAHLLTQSPLATLYSRPLYHTAYFSYLLSLISSLYLLGQPNTSYGGKSLVGIFVILAFGQLPLLRSLAIALKIRGIGIALLLSLAGFIWVFYSHPAQLFWFTWLWALILWGMGHYGLPSFNNRWPQWAVEPTFWPILGFGLLIMAFSSETWQFNHLTYLQTIIPVTFYFVLMLRNTDWKWLPWLVGLALMVSGGVVLLVVSNGVVSLELSRDSELFFIFGITIWVNLLFWLSRVIQRSHEIAHWQFQRLVQPLLIWSIGVIGLQLLGLSFITLLVNFSFSHQHFSSSEVTVLIVWAILLNFSCFHLVSVSMQSVFAHTLILSLLNTTLLLLNGWINTPLLLSLWTGGLLLYFKVNNQAHPIWLTTLATWLWLSFAAALLTFPLLLMPAISMNERLLTLGLLAALSFMFGWFNIHHQMTRSWLVGSVVLAGLFLHLIWLMILPQEQPILLLPWYALQNGLLMWGTFWLRAQNFAIAEDKQAHLHWLLRGLTPVLTSLSLLSLWLAQGMSVLAIAKDQEPLNFFAQLAVIVTYLLLLGGWWRYSPWQKTDKKNWIDSLAILIAGLGIYLRLLGVGFAPPSVWDTAVPLLLSLWTGGLLLYFQVNNQAHQIWLTLRAIWLWLSLATTLLSLILMPAISTNEQLLTLGLLATLSFMFSGFNIHHYAVRGGLVGGVVFLGLFLHLIWLMILPQDQLTSLLPWYALQNGLLMWGTFWLRTQDFFTIAEDKQAHLRWLLRGLALVLASLTLFSLLLAQGMSVLALAKNQETLSFFAQLAVIVTYLLLLGGWWRYSPWQNNHKEIWMGSLAILIAGLGIYLRLLGVGFAPPNVWDTAVLMGSSYVLLAIQHLYPAYPLYRLTLLIPGLAILTVPPQLESIQASMALVAAATLYLLMPRRSQQNLPLYLGLLALNVGLYLWVPSLAQDYKLLQVYTIPAALSLLLMLQLHELELKPSVLNAIRLVALSTLYASATLDVFLQEALSIFILVLALSLAGVILGIALRIRVFLYSSTVFLVLNVVGQLIQFYPEGRLGKAIILMILGILITAGMIWFSIQREIFLQRIDNMRANLATWA
ncbi:hypothetical protein THII_3951 [Thioploca ingrica]|uniref:Uncharacterized protein n=1 Tax=Thioploca ingrica TaxID=40754 RepID=A0A090AIK8_9GAMM|nr:hypothetical protein THII_3951 [Thioploca ingrica]